MKKPTSLANYNLLSDENMGEVDDKLMLGSYLNKMKQSIDTNYKNIQEVASYIYTLFT